MKYIFATLSLLAAASQVALAQSEDEATAEEAAAIVHKRPAKKKEVPTREITGRVINHSQHEGVAGAIVSAYGIEGYSALTDEDGTFTLKVPTFTTAVVVTTPGYNTARVGLNASGVLQEIILQSDAARPTYGADDNILGTSSTRNFDYSTSLNVTTDIQRELGGDMHVVQRSGTPGIGAFITMNGINSLSAGTQPLVVIDGVIVDQQYGREMLHEGFYNDMLTNFNINDIEEVKVMKNGTAIYGAKGANGVLLIKTKRNRSLATRIDVNISGGFELLPKNYSLMNATQFKNYASELLQSTGTEATSFKFLNSDPTYYYYNKYNNDTDWSDLVYENAWTQNYGINVQGGGEVANYNLALGYNKAESTLKENDMNRLNVRFNTDIKLSDHVGLRFDASFSNQTRHLLDQGAPQSYNERTVTSPNYLALVKSPMLSPYSFAVGRIDDASLDNLDEDYLNEALAYMGNDNWRLANPASILQYGSAENKNYYDNSYVNLSLTPYWQINKHLLVKTLFCYSLVNTNEKYYVAVNGVPDYYVNSLGMKVKNEQSSLFGRQNGITSDTQVEWQNQYGAHNIRLYGGFRFMNDTYGLNLNQAYNSESDKKPYANSYPTSKGSNDKWNSMTWYAQAQYNWRQRYYVEGDIAMQSASNFGKEADGLKLAGVVWGIFPSLQAGWVLTNEEWFALKGIDYLKLTAGYGVSGNDNINYNAGRSYFQSTLLLGKVAGLALENIGNTTLKWETTKRFNLGLEGNFINNRLSARFEYFKSWTDDLLTFKQVSFLTGLKQNWCNGGSLENQGYNVTVNAHMLTTRNWNWSVGASVGHYVNTLTSLPDGKDYMDTEIYGATVRSKVGESINCFYGYKTAATSNGHIVYATSEEAAQDGLYYIGANGVDHVPFQAGDVKFVDLNGDGKIDADDRTVIGDANPDIYGNIFTSLSYKNIRLDVNFNYSLGNDVYNYVRSQLESGSMFLNQTTAMNNRWRGEGNITDIPRCYYGDVNGNARFSDRWIEDGSYLRLKTITLSYKLPINNTYIQGISVWAQAHNVFTLSKYLGLDPEFSMSNNVLYQGIDRGLLSQGRSFNLGVKINL